jgi:phospholipid/cholesterol/gamma-HCH transport system substrate-binding protein
MTGRAILLPIAATILGIAAALAGNALLFGNAASGRYTVKIELADADGLVPKSTVKIGGVPGGEVAKVSLIRRRFALVTVGLDGGAAPVGQGASAYVRPVNLLGEKYIDLRPGDLSHPLPAGAVIPLSRTGSPVELDDVLNMLDPGTRARMRIIINEAGVAMAGRGADFNSLLDRLPPALDQTGQLLNQIGQDNHTLQGLIVHSDRVISAITGRRDQLSGLVDSAGRALAVTASRRRQLGATITQAPWTLFRLRNTLGRLQSTANDLSPTMVDLRAAAPPLASTLQALPGFAHAASATLRTAQRVAPALTRLGVQGTPPVVRLRPTAAYLESFAHQLAPLLNTMATGGMRSLLGLVNGWTKVIQTSDGLGHVFRIRLALSKEFLLSPIGRFGGAARGHARRRRGARAPAVANAPAGGGSGQSAPATAPGPLSLFHLPALPLPKVPSRLVPAAPSAGQAGPSQDTLKLFDYLFGS